MKPWVWWSCGPLSFWLLHPVFSLIYPDVAISHTLVSVGHLSWQAFCEVCRRPWRFWGDQRRVQSSVRLTSLSSVFSHTLSLLGLRNLLFVLKTTHWWPQLDLAPVNPPHTPLNVFLLLPPVFLLLKQEIRVILASPPSLFPMSRYQVLSTLNIPISPDWIESGGGGLWE